jgi:hypothetical protein
VYLLRQVTNYVTQWIALLLHIIEALDLKIDPETPFHDKIFVIFLQPARQVLKQYSHSPTYIRVVFHGTSQILRKSEFPFIQFNFFISRAGKITKVCFEMYNNKI